VDLLAILVSDQGEPGLTVTEAHVRVFGKGDGTLGAITQTGKLGGVIPWGDLILSTGMCLIVVSMLIGSTSRCGMGPAGVSPSDRILVWAEEALDWLREAGWLRLKLVRSSMRRALNSVSRDSRSSNSPGETAFEGFFSL